MIPDQSIICFLHDKSNILYEKVEALSKERYKVSGLFRHSHAILAFLIYQNESASRINTCNSSSPGCLVSKFLKKILPSSFPDPGHFGTDPDPRPVALDYGSGSGSGSCAETGPGSCSFIPWFSRSQQKISFFLSCLA